MHIKRADAAAIIEDIRSAMMRDPIVAHARISVGDHVLDRRCPDDVGRVVAVYATNGSADVQWPDARTIVRLDDLTRVTATAGAPDVVEITRERAELALETTRRLLCELADTSCDSRRVERLVRDLLQLGITPAERCRGEAHTNLYIDDCGLCAPRWGYVGPTMVIR